MRVLLVVIASLLIGLRVSDLSFAQEPRVITTIDNSGNDGFGGGTVNVINGGSFTSFFTAIDVNIDSTSSITLLGAGDPLPTTSTITLAAGAQLTLASVAEFTEQGAQIFVNGVSFAADNSILSFAGATATAVPEPGVFALLAGGLSLAWVALRRRR